MKLRPLDVSSLKIELVATEDLRPNPKHVRKHPPKQITKLRRSIDAFGFPIPIVVDEDRMILAGHARFEAAKRRQMPKVPCVTLPGLTSDQKTAFAIADNKLGDESSFDDKGLNAVLKELADVGFDMELTGLDMGELDSRLDGAAGGIMGDSDDQFAEPDQPVVTRLGDVWTLGRHCVVCGDALKAESYAAVLGDAKADMVFSDPPYNVPVGGFVSGLGAVKHREFAMASGEMSTAEFQGFLGGVMRQTTAFSAQGSIHFFCMDWRHLGELLAAGGSAYSEVKNLCVWVKSNAGMGSLYRSQHELVCVFKNGTAPHCNNVELGKHGRHRSNVWDYAGANSFSRTRKADLAAHPTVKPVAMVADAIRDVSKRGGLVLDPFLGSGTTLLAAERSGRRCAGIELDPLYVDTAIRRWTKLTRKQPVLAADGRSFADVAVERLADIGEAAE
jgi:ParB-like chromosome segregation protein Spo0J